MVVREQSLGMKDVKEMKENTIPDQIGDLFCIFVGQVNVQSIMVSWRES